RRPAAARSRRSPPLPELRLPPRLPRRVRGRGPWVTRGHLPCLTYPPPILPRKGECRPVLGARSCPASMEPSRLWGGMRRGWARRSLRAYDRGKENHPLRIRQLPDDLINRIAAGEVVERPASVVKELVENAIDAGASRIAITTEQGGKRLIRIEDDGTGMDREDLLLAVEQHATSKLADDGLDDIRTMGFRGEALASIGAVADLTIGSRTAGATSGLRLEVRRSRVKPPVPQAMNRGTIVEVAELFAAVPARLKFLKSDRAEAAAITDVVRRLAMANPGIHFVLAGSDRTPLNWPAQEGEAALAAR